MKDDLDAARKRARQLTYATHPALHRAIYLHDFNEREGLSWIGMASLEQARKDVAEAIGLRVDSV